MNVMHKNATKKETNLKNVNFQSGCIIFFNLKKFILLFYCFNNIL